jgi:hypothetical protein
MSAYGSNPANDPSRQVDGRRSIPTDYNGLTFRSKLEADWARAFDTLDVVWEYERKGRYFGDVFYLPDFYLPKSRQYVEVKGVFERRDFVKFNALLKHTPRRTYTGEWCPDIPLVTCEPGGVFRGWRRRLIDVDAPIDVVLATAPSRVELFACTQCRGWWFCDSDESFRCQCCGAHDGDHYVASIVSSPLPEFPNVHALHFLIPD